MSRETKSDLQTRLAEINNKLKDAHSVIERHINRINELKKERSEHIEELESLRECVLLSTKPQKELIAMINLLHRSKDAREAQFTQAIRNIDEALRPFDRI